MTDYLLLFLADIVLGFMLQAIGYAVCLYTFVNKRIDSKDFMITSVIYSLIAVVIRFAYDINLINFGFHTIVIWLIYLLVAIFFNKLPAIKSTISICVSGIIITFTEILTVIVMTAKLGSERFDQIMNNTTTIDGQIQKAIYGIPANILFLVIVFVAYFIVKNKRSKASITVEENKDA
jgi:hypothetical protein